MNSTEIAKQVRTIIDDLWAQEISTEDAQKQITSILDNRENRLKIFRGNEKSAVFTRVLGTKRMKSFDELLKDMNI